MNKLDKQYQDLLKTILEYGIEKEDRTGTGTISTFGKQIRHNMKDGFPLLTTKRMAVKSMVTELKWFLKGDTNIKYLVDNGCNIWVGDAYKNYCTAYKDGHEFYEDEQVKRSFTQEEFVEKIKTDNEFANKWGQLGPIYGSQWRSWRVGKGIETTLKTEDGETIYEAGSMYIDQIQNLINELKTNPDSRRLMVNAWNVGELDQMTLPPCHYGFQVYTRELDIEYRAMLSGEFNENTLRVDQFIEMYGMRLLEQKLDEYNIPKRAISLMWNQRSVDTFLGLPFNIASYGLLLELIAKEVNMVPDELIGNLGDTHLYSNHIEQAKEQIGRELSLEERFEIVSKREGTVLEETKHIWSWNTDKETHNHMTLNNIPTRTREPYDLPTIKLSNVDILNGEFDYEIIDYQSHPTIKAPLSN